MSNKVLRVTEVRRSKCWSQAELARQVGCNASSISRIERGIEPAYPIRGQKIADALGWSGDYRQLFIEVD